MKDNKILKTILIIVIVIAIILIVDFFAMLVLKTRPVFAISGDTYNDGGSREYYGLLYKAIKCNTTSGKKDIEIGWYSMKYSCEETKNVKEIDTTGYEKITDMDKMLTNYSNFIDILNYSFKESVDKIDEEYAKSVAMYAFGYSGKISEQEFIGYIKYTFGYDVEFVTGEYKLSNGKNTVKITKADDEFYNIETDLDYRLNSDEWFEISAAYVKEDKHILEYELKKRVNETENIEDSTIEVIGKSYIIIEKDTDNYKVDEVVFIAK